MAGSITTSVKGGLGRGTVSVRADITTDASGDASVTPTAAVFGRLVGVSYAPDRQSTAPLPQVNTVTVDATSGTWTVTKSGTTRSFQYNDTAATVQADLRTNWSNAVLTVTRTGANPYVFTITLTGATVYAAITVADSTLAGGGDTVTVDRRALDTGADITIADAITGATILVLTDAGTSTRRFRPTKVVAAGVGLTALTADTSNNDLNRDIYVAGQLSISVAQGGAVASGSVLLTIEEV